MKTYPRSRSRRLFEGEYRYPLADDLPPLVAVPLVVVFGYILLVLISSL